MGSSLSSLSGLSGRLRAVSFDCWSTLIYERDRRGALDRRAALMVRAAADAGVELEPDRARRLLGEAFQRHHRLWIEGVASGAREMAGWALEGAGIADPPRATALAEQLGRVSLESEISALDGAGETLEAARRRGIATALICDTGFSPGAVVRRLLDRVGLLAGLDVQIFSDECGVPKPDARMFESALTPLGAVPGEAVHVGDLRRTDVAGARAFGMRTIRLRWHNDDQSELPDGDHVADSHAHLREILEL